MSLNDRRAKKVVYWMRGTKNQYSILNSSRIIAFCNKVTDDFT